MTGCPEFKYWLKDNEKLILKDEDLPAWIASLNALEALIPVLEKNHPQDAEAEDEDVDPQF